MSQELAELLDLDLAWKRMRADMADRVFVRHPYELELVERNLQDWLSALKEQIRTNGYNPSSLLICDVPKAHAAVRPGAHLRINDALIFASLVSSAFPSLHETLKWAQQTVDYSYTLADSPDSPKWIVPEISGWKRFEEHTISRLDSGDVSHVVFADITGYYENIDIATLISDVRGSGVARPVELCLSNCLNRWSQCPGRGIPQGHAPSDILAKLYLNTVDIALQGSGYSHIRYVDDFRIFCGSLQEARRAILRLSKLLRRLGLNLQTSKTEILDAKDSLAKIKAITSRVKDVRYKLWHQAELATELGDPYLMLDFSEELRCGDPSSSPDEAPIEVIREAFSEYIIGDIIYDSDSSNRSVVFDKTLFHFLLNRLAKENDAYAASHCVRLLATHPEETRFICRYLARVGQVQFQEAAVLEFLVSSDSVYEYQIYQLIEWRLSDSATPSSDFVSFVRRLTFDGSQPSYLRAVCRQFIGQHGSRSDLDRLEAEYATVGGDLEQCEIICSLRRMERTRRNSFAARLVNDSHLHRRALDWIRSAD